MSAAAKQTATPAKPYESPSIRARLDAVDKTFGAGETYDSATRRRILEGEIPEWLARGRKLLDREDAERCDKTIAGLLKMHGELMPEIELRTRGESGKKKEKSK